MSVTQFRPAYFPSSGSASGLTPNAQWTDTSNALVLPGVWDTPSGTGDVLNSFNTSYTGAPSSPPIAFVLAAQIVFPAFGSGMNFQTPPGTLGWVSFDPTPALLTKFAQVPVGPPNVSVQAEGLLRVFKSDNTLRTESRKGVTVNAVSTSLVGRGFNDFPEATPVKQVFSTDYLVVEIGFRLSSFSTATFTVTLSYQLGDSHSNLVVSGSSVNGNSGCKIRWFGPAGGALSASGAGFIKPTHPTKHATRFQSPSVPDRQSSILNEFILGDQVL